MQISAQWRKERRRYFISACTKTRNAETKPPKRPKRPKRCDRNHRNDRNKEKYIFKWPKTRFSVFSRPRAPHLGRHAMLSVISRDIPIISAYIYSKGFFWWPFLLGSLFSEGLLSEFYFVINSLFSSVTYSIGHVDLSLYISPSPHLHFLIVTWSFTVSDGTLRPLKQIRVMRVMGWIYPQEPVALNVKVNTNSKWTIF